jgi:hypothetical protein
VPRYPPIDHIIAQARGEFGHEYQWMPRNIQILCHEHNQEKMIKFDDWRPLWARVLMPVRIHPRRIGQKFERHLVRMNTAEPTPLRHRMWRKSVARILSHRTRAIRSDPVRNNPEPVDQSAHWVSRKTMGKLATARWDGGVVLPVVSIFLLIARIVGHCVGFKWRW